MRIVRDRADARWLPSRYRFAIFRLTAWLLLRRSRSEIREGLVLGIDRDQNAVESYTVGIWLTANASLFLLAFFQPYIFRPVAPVVAFLVTVIGFQVLITAFAFGPRSWRQQNHIELQSFTHMFVVTVAAIHFAGTDGWIRWVAWAFLLVLGINTAAAAAVRGLRGRIDAAEREIVAS
ncbi:MAG TPA: hypothetical protein VM779_05775 [Thermoanaerobaculia bacterium]|nr:hypothetical protein [Thermoanaerobaculia bacterium]